MNAVENRNTIRRFILDRYLFTKDECALEDSASLIVVGVIEFMGIMEIVGFIKETFGIKINASEIYPSNVDSVNNLVAFVTCKKARGVAIFTESLFWASQPKQAVKITQPRMPAAPPVVLSLMFAT